MDPKGEEKATMVDDSNDRKDNESSSDSDDEKGKTERINIKGVTFEIPKGKGAVIKKTINDGYVGEITEKTKKNLRNQGLLLTEDEKEQYDEWKREKEENETTETTESDEKKKEKKPDTTTDQIKDRDNGQVKQQIKEVKEKAQLKLEKEQREKEKVMEDYKVLEKKVTQIEKERHIFDSIGEDIKPNIKLKKYWLSELCDYLLVERNSEGGIEVVGVANHQEDEDMTIIRNEDGSISKKMDPETTDEMTIKQLVTTFFTKKPVFTVANDTGVAGSTAKEGEVKKEIPGTPAHYGKKQKPKITIKTV